MGAFKEYGPSGREEIRKPLRKSEKEKKTLIGLPCFLSFIAKV